MKNSKKLVALVLAMVMIFALTASALAATDSTMTVYVTVNKTAKESSSSTTETVTETYYTSQAVTVPANATVYDLMQAMSDAGMSLGYDACWKNVPLVDANGNKTGEYGKALVSLSLNTTNTATKTDTYLTLSSMSTTTKQDVQELFSYYQYNYSGSGWTYKVNNTTPDVYMDSYTLTAGDTVTLSYCTTTDSWREYYIAE